MPSQIQDVRKMGGMMRTDVHSIVQGPRWLPWVMNLYRYDRVMRETDRQIVLMVRTPGGDREARLPKKSVRVYRHLHEVEIPEWICVQEGLI